MAPRRSTSKRSSTSPRDKSPTNKRARSPVSSARLGLGRSSEKRAAELLVSIGYRIIAQNWRSPDTRNELDLVAVDGDCLVFVEVKAARSGQYGDPLSWITPRKQAAVIRAARSYLSEVNPTYNEFRFDTVTIAPPSSDGISVLVHTKGAFDAPE